MDTFYCPNLTIETQSISLPDREMKHAVQVKRQRVGDYVHLVNGTGVSAKAMIYELSRRDCVCQIETAVELPPPSAHVLTIAMSTIRPNRMDYAVEKLCEIGVGNIHFLHNKNTSIHTFKQAHLEKISISAMKQSKQAWLTTVSPPVQLTEWISTLPQNIAKLIAHTAIKNTTKPLIPSQHPTVLLIGPEGGFSEEEYQTAIDHNFQPLSLGDTILRAETAAVVGAAKILSTI